MSPEAFQQHKSLISVEYYNVDIVELFVKNVFDYILDLQPKVIGKSMPVVRRRRSLCFGYNILPINKYFSYFN